MSRTVHFARSRALLFFMLLTAGCDEATGPQLVPTVTGSWTGTSQGVTLNLTLMEGLGGSVAGSGNIVLGSGENLALTVRQGSHAHPDLSLVLGTIGYPEINLVGRLSAPDAISGTLNGFGFNDFDLNLTKR